MLYFGIILYLKTSCQGTIDSSHYQFLLLLTSYINIMHLLSKCRNQHWYNIINQTLYFLCRFHQFFHLCFYSWPRFHPRHHPIMPNCPISYLWQFIALSLFFMMLEALKSIGQIFYKLSLKLGLLCLDTGRGLMKNIIMWCIFPMASHHGDAYYQHDLSVVTIILVIKIWFLGNWCPVSKQEYNFKNVFWGQKGLGIESNNTFWKRIGDLSFQHEEGKFVYENWINLAMAHCIFLP